MAERDKEQNNGLVGFLKRGLNNVGDKLKSNPITGSIYAAFKGLGTKWEKGKTNAFKADIQNMIEKLKTKIIELFKNMSESLNKEAQEKGSKVLNGEFSGKTEIMEEMKKAGLDPTSDLPGKGKTIVNDFERFINKDGSPKLINDLSETLKSAGAKAGPGLGIANNPGLEIDKTGMNIGK